MGFDIDADSLVQGVQVVRDCYIARLMHLASSLDDAMSAPVAMRCENAGQARLVRRNNVTVLGDGGIPCGPCYLACSVLYKQSRAHHFIPGGRGMLHVSSAE